MENRITRFPSGNFDVDLFGDSSRKRKSTAMDQPGSICESKFQYCTPWDSNLPRENLVSGAQVEENTRGLCLGIPKSINATTLSHQFEKDQFHNQDWYAGSWLNCNGNFHGSGTKNIRNASSLLPPQPLEYKGSFESLNMRAGESVVNWQPQRHNPLGASESYTSLPLLKSYDAHTGRPQVSSRFEEVVSFGSNNDVVDKRPMGLCISPSKNLSVKAHSDDNGITCSQEDNVSGVSSEMRQSSHCSNNGGINDAATVGAASFGSSLCIEQSRNRLQNEVHFGSRGSLGVPLGEISQNEEQGCQVGCVKIKETTEASDVQNLMHPLPEESSSKNDSAAKTIENGQQNDQALGSLKSDEKSKSHLGKPASIVAEKLWDGSLQLSSSVTLSAVAFFKSGEKLLDTTWGESVEVKGKVRLEAFEKYIQDLPRSRNRGLMVISLCWKEGSSETGLEGMKLVAKAYKKGERVGFAHLSPGIDLYICPRSDAIITILAKYGFFKGMAAVEDNRDSMIGCVVWRKNRISSNLVVKKPENKPSVSPMNQPASVIASSSVEGTEKSGCESKNSISEKIQMEMDSSLPGPNSLVSASTPNESTSISVGPELPKRSLKLQESVMPFPSDTRKVRTMPSLDDDDLPEFEFRTSRGISQTNMSTPFVTVLPLTANEGIPPLKKICDREPEILVFPNMEQRSSVPDIGTTTPVSANMFACRKNLFDDDIDDMPEWCPPELQRQSLAEKTRLLTNLPSEFQNPTFQNLAQGPSWPGIPCPSPAATRPPFSSRDFPPGFHIPTSKAPQPRPLGRGPSSSMGPKSNSILGPPPSFDVKPPSRRGRRHE